METYRICAAHNNIVCTEQIPQQNFQLFELKTFKEHHSTPAYFAYILIMYISHINLHSNMSEMVRKKNCSTKSWTWQSERE